MVRMDGPALRSFLVEVFPAAIATGIHIDTVDEHGVCLSWEVGEAHLRPGGTVSGPTLMTLADTAAYLLVLSRLGPVALAVTTSMDVHFLRRAVAGRLVARAVALRLGRRIAVVQVEVDGPTGGEVARVAVGTVTYAIPD